MSRYLNSICHRPASSKSLRSVSRRFVGFSEREQQFNDIEVTVSLMGSVWEQLLVLGSFRATAPRQEHHTLFLFFSYFYFPFSSSSSFSSSVSFYFPVSSSSSCHLLLLSFSLSSFCLLLLSLLSLPSISSPPASLFLLSPPLTSLSLPPLCLLVLSFSFCLLFLLLLCLLLPSCFLLPLSPPPLV